MDPLTHGLLGAAVAQAVLPASEGRKALLLGAVAGTLADADVLLRIVSDPALPWEVHRHATHALIASPLGGLVAALPFFLGAAGRARWKGTLLAATLAYMTHGLLDACTSYGTSLLLPFSGGRAAWDVIAIVDPLFTLPLLAGALLAAWRLRRVPAVAALALCAAYLGLGARQHALALQEVHRIAASRGHVVERARALPTPMNLIVWRGLYVSEGRIHADGGRVPLVSAPRFRPGASIPLLLPEAGASEGADVARAARIADVEARFARFADGFAARDPERPDILADMRYSLEVASFAPLWGIRVGGAGADPVSWVDLAGDRRASLRRMWDDLRRH